MTTIAYKDGVVAADRLCSYHSAAVTKLMRYSGGVIGGSGSAASEVIAMMHYVCSDKRAPAPTIAEGNTVEILDARKDGTVWMCKDGGRPYQIEEGFFAVGSGSDYAMGAMAMGASAEDAVSVASRYDIYTGSGVDVFRVAG